MKKPELLIPAGGPETLRVAVDYGADAVYIGGNRFGLRLPVLTRLTQALIIGTRQVHRTQIQILGEQSRSRVSRS